LNSAESLSALTAVDHIVLTTELDGIIGWLLNGKYLPPTKFPMGENQKK